MRMIQIAVTLMTLMAFTLAAHASGGPPTHRTQYEVPTPKPRNEYTPEFLHWYCMFYRNGEKNECK